MSYIPVDSKFKLRLLALSVSLSFCMPVWAMQAIDDEDLASSTGEGIAFLPENFSLLFQGANDVNPTAADLNDRTKDTGYIRLIPVGPLTTEAQNAGAGKADIYLYGLAISQSAQNYGANRTSADWNNRFSRTINSWGSAANPWLFKVQTANSVPNFSATTPTDTGNGSVTYLALEAPRFNVDTDGNLTDGINAGINALSTAEKSAYNLKLGFWADALVRNPNVAENLTATGTQFDVGGAGRANRLRLQGVWDGLSLNGTQLQIFQTLGGATNTGGMSTFYNNTLGIAGLLRFNSGDGQNLRATITQNATMSATTVTMLNDGGGATGCNNGTTASEPTYGTLDCQNRTRVSQATNTANATWTPPATGSVLRLSTRESGTGQGLLSTPGINGGVAPTFDANEGVFIYNANINLVLGSLYQPLTVGVAPDGKNLTLEIARIPNKESIYKQVYTNYANSNPATNGGYYGSTCNIYQCGNNGTTGYQGTNATHSSITIGSTSYNPSTNTITAYSGVEAVGISFGALTANTNTVNTTYTQVEDQLRRRNTRQYSCGFLGLSTCDTYDWAYRKADGSYVAPAQTANNGSFPTLNNRSWTYATTNVPAAWMNKASTSYGGGYTSTSGGIPSAAIQNAPAISAPNNFGSAAIDGLLIQHMKITTKGL